MRYQHQPGKGPRSNAYSEARFTNWTEFHPWNSAVFRAHAAYLRDADATAHPLYVQVNEPHPDFVRPVSENDIRETLATVPERFTSGLRAVFVLTGSRKQARVAHRLFCYGTYYRRCIFLAPFPRTMMQRTYRRQPRPSLLLEWERAGAEIREISAGLRVTIDEAALRCFYLRDVLMHEVGHHVDTRPHEPKRTQEGFAEWFASEYGFRLRADLEDAREPYGPASQWRF